MRMPGFIMEVEPLAPTISAFEKLKDYLSNPEVWSSWLQTAIQIVLALLIGRIVTKLAQKALERLMVVRERTPLRLDQRRTNTIGKLLNNIVTYTINFILILIILGQFGINLAPVLAGAGVLGLAIGFGAQSLVKDIITGFFIIFEDQFGVGDVIQTGAFKGTVEEIGLRVTRVRTATGEVHILPNGSIQQVTNFSIYNSLAVVDVPVANGDNLEKIIALINKAAADSYNSIPNLTKPPEVLGLQTLGAAESVIRVTAECKPNTQGSVEREMKRMIKDCLDRYKEQINAAEG
ncbi:mechanosensitive ion channel family protein [Paenibacillus sp. YN15]|uniref:mechanosensitive ion channel family protein n=1 Tax=Paenibacillus sp. YN15 TaxID=1742774 RepID=UPI000DCEEF46|nr:mechanosensitive ion channel family protein [Paenibacillus sp. YN15]RAU91789.1 mechanosensitive ion channel family protein [Paenibacillus sp. YN15]